MEIRIWGTNNWQVYLRDKKITASKRKELRKSGLYVKEFPPNVLSSILGALAAQ